MSIPSPIPSPVPPPTPSHYPNRSEAGKLLAHHLLPFASRPNLLVLALPRGGVPVAAEVAHSLNCALDVLLVRKLGLPGQEELALGAIALGGTSNIRVLNHDLINQLSIPPSIIDQVAAEESVELRRRSHAFRGSRPPPNIHNRTVILIDDGIATGASILVAIKVIQSSHPTELIVAVPVAAQDTLATLRPLVDHLICPLTPVPFRAVGRWYDDFSQTTDEEVKTLLSQNAAGTPRG